MGYIGKWAFHSAGMISDEDQWVFLSAEEYLHSPMPYVDETDEDAVADELRERKQMIGSKLAVCEDGKMYLLMPIPEGVTQEQVDAAAKTLRDAINALNEQVTILIIAHRLATVRTAQYAMVLENGQITEESSLGHVIIGGINKELTGAHANIGGAWKDISGIYMNIGGTWKEMP